jgi:xanthine/CO dehydrogenase XdhC/CoxF family maturation factor
MTELERLLDAHAGATSGVSVLATLTGVDGSSYRGVGARMLVLPDNRTVGAISGGCLERDLVAHAEQVRSRTRPDVVAYDLRRDDEAIWGLNMGCNARLEVLLEPAPALTRPAALAAAADAQARREPAILGLACGPGDPALGSWLILTASGTLAGPLSRELRPPHDAAALLREERTARVAGVLLQYLAPPIQVVACGDGPDIEPLVRLAGELGWAARRVGKDEPLGALDARTAVVLMSHNYPRDLALLGESLASPAAYIGLLGPTARTARLVEELRARGTAAAPGQLERLHGPVGLDIGADTPAEVALAITAEIRAAFAGRRGGRLRERSGPIHDRSG